MLERMSYRYKPWRSNKKDQPEIETGGVDIGPHTYEIYRRGPYAVWHTPGYSWGSSGWDRDYEPTCYRVVRYYQETRTNQAVAAHNGTVEDWADLLWERRTDETPWRELRDEAYRIVEELANITAAAARLADEDLIPVAVAITRGGRIRLVEDPEEAAANANQG